MGLNSSGASQQVPPPDTARPTVTRHANLGFPVELLPQDLNLNTIAEPTNQPVQTPFSPAQTPFSRPTPTRFAFVFVFALLTHVISKKEHLCLFEGVVALTDKYNNQDQSR
jgi:hypothetical protein